VPHHRAVRGIKPATTSVWKVVCKSRPRRRRVPRFPIAAPVARPRHRERRVRARPSRGQRRKRSGTWTTVSNNLPTGARRREMQPISRPLLTATGKAQGLLTAILLTEILLKGALLTGALGTVTAGRIRTRIVHRAGAANDPETTAKPPDMATAGRSRTSAEARTGAATGRTNTPAKIVVARGTIVGYSGTTVASSAELRARMIA
jgi:hypothetical protein